MLDAQTSQNIARWNQEIEAADTQERLEELKRKKLYGSSLMQKPSAKVRLKNPMTGRLTDGPEITQEEAADRLQATNLSNQLNEARENMRRIGRPIPMV